MGKSVARTTRRIITVRIEANPPDREIGNPLRDTTKEPPPFRLSVEDRISGYFYWDIT